MLFGLAPAFQSTRTDLASTLKSESGSVLGGRARLRQALVASQVAVSLLLLVGAALFIRTLANLGAVDIGIKTTNLLAFEVDPSRNGYPRPAYQAVLEAAAGARADFSERAERQPGDHAHSGRQSMEQLGRD